MATDATGVAETGPLRLEFDRSVKVEFCGSAISSDGGLLLHRELDEACRTWRRVCLLICAPVEMDGTASRASCANLFSRAWSDVALPLNLRYGAFDVIFCL